MTDKPKTTDRDTKKPEDVVLEPDEVVFDAAQTAFLEDSVAREDAKK